MREQHEVRHLDVEHDGRFVDCFVIDLHHRRRRPHHVSSDLDADADQEASVPRVFSVAVVQWNWTDASRPTHSYRGSTPKPGRALPTTVFIPTIDGKPARADAPFPLFVWAHGLDASVAYYQPLLRAWAARGYVVAAPTFPLTRAGLPHGGDFNDYVNQPGDISFVIDKMLAAYGPSGSVHYGLVDPSRIGVGGHSLGAVTTMALVANRCCLDEQVKAAVEIDGARLPFPNGHPTTGRAPLLLIHGDADRTFPVAQSRVSYSVALPPKYLIILHGIPHTPFPIPAAYTVIVNSVGDFLDAYLKSRPDGLTRLVKDSQPAGLATLTFAR